eukprot:PRCOL_00000904-RA
MASAEVAPPAAGDAVWIKIERTPWWPAKVLSDEEMREVPQLAEAAADHEGYVPCKFFGNYDYLWAPVGSTIRPFRNAQTQELLKQAPATKRHTAIQEALKYELATVGGSAPAGAGGGDAAATAGDGAGGRTRRGERGARKSAEANGDAAEDEPALQGDNEDAQPKDAAQGAPKQEHSAEAAAEAGGDEEGGEGKDVAMDEGEDAAAGDGDGDGGDADDAEEDPFAAFAMLTDIAMQVADGKAEAEPEEAEEASEQEMETDPGEARQIQDILQNLVGARPKNAAKNHKVFAHPVWLAHGARTNATGRSILTPEQGKKALRRTFTKTVRKKIPPMRRRRSAAGDDGGRRRSGKSSGSRSGAKKNAPAGTPTGARSEVPGNGVPTMQQMMPQLPQLPGLSGFPMPGGLPGMPGAPFGFP